ncbi:MAG: hypothetical protein P8R42_19635 [Candidatus Binatia bacterium]|nr:hypothetical protein [Candidatus Binatia bacterium]
MVEKLETDYLVIGSGAMGMAFTDEMITRNPRAHFFLVDKHARAGGHWNDAYGHVSLHQPADFYEVNSEILGRGGAALASGTEVMAYYERVLAKLVASERLQHFPMCESLGEGRLRSLVQPEREYEVTVREKTVDATYMNVQVPSIRPPLFAVAPEIELVALKLRFAPRGPPGSPTPHSRSRSTHLRASAW